MKKIIFAIITISLLNGCAKVSQEAIPCGANKPATPVVQSTVVIPNSYSSQYIYALSNAGATYRWTGPNGYTATGNPIEIGGYYSSNVYGQYSVVAYLNGCASDVATFTVVSSAPPSYGTPSCSPASRTFTKNSATWIQFPYAISNEGVQNGKLQISGSDGYLTNVDIYLPVNTVPAAGTYLDIDSNGDYESGGAIIQVNDHYNYAYYTSVSGRIYFTANSNIVLCSVIFKGGSGTTSRYNVSGKVDYY